MKKLSEILLGVAMVAATPAVMAQSKPNTYVDADMKTRLFTLGWKSEGDKSVITRALSDDTVGVLCDWKITGKIDPETNLITAEVKHHQCSAEKTTPENWLGGNLLDDDRFSPSSHKLIPLSGSPSVVEMRITDTNHLEVTSTYSRVWNFAKNEVCIRHYEGQFVGGRLNVYVDMDGGCHPMPKNNYANKVRGHLDPKWSSLKAQ